MKDELLAALTAQDNARARTQQKAIGPSQLGGCRRAIMYQMRDTPKVNETERLASMMGTAIHAMIEQAFKEHTDPWEYLLEAEVPGVEEIGLGPAHVDCYRHSDKSVNDWKTTAKKNQRYFPSQKQLWQVHVYGFLMNRAGYPVEIVRLISIARDGHSSDIIVHEEPYDEDVAYQAMDWLADIHARRDDLDYLPPADLSGPICWSFCPYYNEDTLCQTAKPLKA